MKQKLEKVVTTLMPDAIPGKDFVIEFNSEERPYFAYWNTPKLGPPHALEEMRIPYLKLMKIRKSSDPATDDSDPMPWIAEEEARRVEIIEREKFMPEVLDNGTVVHRVR